MNLDHLRVEAVEARGLDPAAANFVMGTTLADIEQEADDLAQVIGQHEQPDEGESVQFGSDFFSRAAADKQRRRSELLGALTGRPRQERQERDEQGRFASGGFDGGSRTPPPPRPPSHDETLGELFRSKAADVGRSL